MYFVAIPCIDYTVETECLVKRDPVIDVLF